MSLIVVVVLITEFQNIFKKKNRNTGATSEKHAVFSTWIFSHNLTLHMSTSVTKLIEKNIFVRMPLPDSRSSAVMIIL